MSNDRVWSRMVAAVLAVLVLGCCGRVSDPGSSESHFLQSCSNSCASPLQCVCGVCTLPCAADSDCSTLGTGVECVAQLANEGATCPSALDAGSGTCQIPCAANSDCASLGGGAGCIQGQCRVNPTSGAGGAGGAGGSAAVIAGCTEDGMAPPVACPPSPPQAGQPCDPTMSSTTCAYASSSGLQTFYCNPPDSIWTATAWTTIPGDCATRTPVACSTPGATERTDLDAVVSSIFGDCGFPLESGLSVLFSNGCATAFFAGPSGSPAAACAATRLSSERYDCATLFECGAYFHSALR